MLVQVCLPHGQRAQIQFRNTATGEMWFIIRNTSHYSVDYVNEVSLILPKSVVKTIIENIDRFNNGNEFPARRYKFPDVGANAYHILFEANQYSDRKLEIAIATESKFGGILNEAFIQLDRDNAKLVADELRYRLLED